MINLLDDRSVVQRVLDHIDQQTTTNASSAANSRIF
jgi:hypothetical protein